MSASAPAPAPASPDAAQRRAATAWLLVGLLCVWGAFLRLGHIGVPGLWWDEFISLDKALLPLSQLWPTLMSWGTGDAGIELFPPLYHAVLHGVLGADASDQALRAVSVVFGVLTIPATFVLARELFGTRAALTAALLLATSSYHIHYSREVRPYALFVLENACALAALHAGLVRGRAWVWPAYAASMAAMLYTSYMASTVCAAHGLFAAAQLLPELAAGGRRRRAAVRRAWGVGLAWLGALAAYAPWLPGQLLTMATMNQAPNVVKPNLDFLPQAFTEFASYAYVGDIPIAAVLAATAAAGACAALRSGHARQAALLTIWALMPFAALFVSKSGISLSSRYIITVYYACLLFVAYLLAWVADRAVRGLGLPRFARWPSGLVLALLLALGLASPSLGYMDLYAKREPSQYKQAMAWLMQNKADTPWLAFASNRGLKLVSRWYLGQAYDTLKDYSPQGYKRAYLLAPESFTPREPGQALRATVREAKVWAVGLAGAGRVLLAPDAAGRAAYACDFSTLDFYRHAAKARNMGPDITKGALAPFDPRQASLAVFAFEAPDGARFERASLELTFLGTFFSTIKSPAKAQVSFSQDGHSFTPLVSLAAGDFVTSAAKSAVADEAVSQTIDLPAALKGARTFFVSVSFDGVEAFGDITLSRFGLAAELSGSPAPAGVARQAMQALAAENALVSWRPGLALTGGASLFAFACAGAEAFGPVGTPQELEAFRREHKGLDPVRLVRFADGGPAYVLFDTTLADPFIEAGPDRQPEVALPGGDRPRLPALRLRGQFGFPALTLGASRLTAPLTAVFDSQVDINALGQSLWTVAPLFTASGAGQFAGLGDNLRRAPQEDCLTCDKDAPCFLEFEVVSGWPIKGFRLVSYPRVFADAKGKNRLAASYAVNAGRFTPLYDYRPAPSGKWEGLKVRRIQNVALAAPAGRLALRFALSGPGAQLWSAPDARMTLEIILDTAGVKPLEPGGPRVRLAANQPLEVQLLSEPVRFPGKLNLDY